MKHVLIVGASRGIGLGLVDVHLEAGWSVHATTRDGSQPRSHPDLAVYQLEVRDHGQLEALTSRLAGPIDRVIHNAGISGAPRQVIMEVNTEAPIRVVETLLDASLIRRGGTVAIMTSQMGARRGRTGSLGDYGDSKAALNDEFRRRVPDWRSKGVIAVVIHPGWVATDMGGAGAPITVVESSTGVMTVMDGLTSDDHGKFLTWDGRIHPW